MHITFEEVHIIEKFKELVLLLKDAYSAVNLLK